MQNNKFKGATMKCIICESADTRYFNGVGSEILKKSEYHQCKNCGFVYSKTLFEMEDEKWSKLNLETHS